MELDPQDLDILARTIWGEARGESWLGQVAVAWVINTRTVTPRRWRATIRETCLQPQQCSCWLTSDPNRSLLERLSADKDTTFRGCLAAAVVLVGLVEDPTQAANHDVNLEALPRPPRWYDPSRVTAVVGHHTFLRL